jgi:hypothetical protein
LLLTAASDAPPGPALALTREIASRLVLEPLSTSQTEALLRSVFGDVAHVAGLSERVHRVTEGNPSWAMTVAEQLVDQGVARYEAGSWTLPAELQPGVLPQYLASALWRRLAALTPDARELGEALALTDPALLHVSQYRLLTGHGDAGRVYEALNALVAAGILIAEGDRYRFGQQGLRELLCEGQDARRTGAVHARIAQALDHGQHPFALAHHRLLAGEERAALALLVAAIGRGAVTSGGAAIDLAERALQAAERLRLPLHERLALREWLVRLSALLGLPQATLHGLALVDQYDRDSGLRDYREMPADLPEAERVAAAIERARQRHASADPNERGFAPEKAMTHLSKVCSNMVAFASIAEDLALLEGLPSLRPLCDVSPALAVARLHIEMQIGTITGASRSVLRNCRELLRRLDQPDRAGFSSERARAFRLGLVYVLGLWAAGGAQPTVRNSIAELQRTPGYRANAWRVRMVYELMQGNQDAAMVCQRRAELMQLQDSGQALYPGTTLMIELLAAIYSDDLIAVKRIRERVEEIAARHPSWHVAACLARCHYRRLQGDPAGALQELAPALQVVKPGRQANWSLIVASQVSLLAALGHPQDAADIGLQAVADAERASHWSFYPHLMRCAAEAALLAGRTEDALRLMDRCVAWHERYGPGGIPQMLSYEARARVAIAMRDQPGLQHYFDLCAEQFGSRRDAALSRKYERLKEEAEEVGLTLAPPARAPIASALEKRRPRIAELLAQSG